MINLSRHFNCRNINLKLVKESKLSKSRSVIYFALIYASSSFDIPEYFLNYLLTLKLEIPEQWLKIFSSSFGGSHLQTGHERDMACGCQRCSAGHSVGPASDPEYLSGAPARDKPRQCRWSVLQTGGSSSRWTPRRHFGGLLLHLHGLRSSADQTQARLHRRDCLLGHSSHRSLRALPRLSIHNSTREFRSL